LKPGPWHGKYGTTLLRTAATDCHYGLQLYSAHPLLDSLASPAGSPALRTFW
jgi:hypothetical protein